MKILNVMAWVCVLLGVVSPAFASTYYVSATGNDSGDGSAATPWKTIQHAADNVSAGDSVIVRPGTYAGFVLGWDYPQNGTASHPITFQADPGAIINKRNNKTPDGINLEGASYIRIEGFTIQNGDGSISRGGIRSVTNTHVVIRGNTIDGMGTWGIFTGFSENVLIENNETSRSVSQHGIYVSNSADNPTIRGNRSWGNNQCGIHMNGDVSQGGDGIISGALIEANIIHDNGRAGGSAINCDGVQSSVIRNNVLYNNHASGISLYAIDGAEGSKNNVVINNTIIEAADARWAINIKDESTGNTVLNNILFNNNSSHGSINIVADSLPGFSSDYNIVQNRFSADDGDSTLTLSQWQSQTGQDVNSLIATQASVFLDAGANDYHLSPTSAAIDKGTSAFGVAEDIEGNSRPHGLGWDIGAYEFSYASPCDFNGDGKTDVLWRQMSSGTVAIWLMNGTSIASVGVPGGATADWQNKGVGDFDGDGKADILWRDSSGTVAIWLMNGTAISSVGILGSVASDWEVKGVGDFDGDGKADILWQSTATGTVVIWLMNGAMIWSVGIPGVISADWQVKGVGDFNGDGKADILWYHPASGTVAFWLMNGGSISSVGVVGSIPTDWQVQGVGDFDNDGKSDVLWRHSSGTVAIWLMDGMTISSVGIPGAVPTDWQVKGVGDFDGDGKSDILWYHPASGTVAFWLMNGGSISSVGVVGSIPTDWQIVVQ